MRLTKPGFLIGVVFLIGCFLATDCTRNPVTGKRQLTLITEAEEISYGKAAHPEILKEFGEVQNKQLQVYVSELGLRIADISHRPHLPWHFSVIDAPVVNAFALPGGYIYITREILAYMNNEAELAGVLGHEIGHVTARHSVSQISRSMLFGIGIGIGSVFSPTFAQLSDFAQLGVGILFLKHGRDHERESDRLGVAYSYESGYDPRQLGHFFQVFEAMQEKSGQTLPGWLSTHPAPPDRMSATTAQAQQLVDQNLDHQLNVKRTNFLTQINGIMFGENPREGFVQNGLFLHPELRFQLRIPEGWKTVNSKASVVFVDPGRSAQVQLTLAPAGTSLEQQASELAQQQGIRLVEQRQTRINGNRALATKYSVSSQSGSTRPVRVNYISYRDFIYRLRGEAINFSRFSRQIESVLSSFEQLRDRRALNAQPDLVQVHRIKGGESLQSIANQYANPRVDVDELALLNRLDKNAPLREGALLKIVKPGQR